MHREPFKLRSDDGNPGGGIVGVRSPAGLCACAARTLIAASTTSVLADTKIYEFISTTSLVPFAKESTAEPVGRFVARRGITVAWKISNLT